MKRWQKIFGWLVLLLLLACIIVVPRYTQEDSSSHNLDLSIFNDDNPARIIENIKGKKDVTFTVTGFEMGSSDDYCKVYGSSDDPIFNFVSILSIEDTAMLNIGDMITVRGAIDFYKYDEDSKMRIYIGDYVDAFFFGLQYAKIVGIG